MSKSVARTILSVAPVALSTAFAVFSVLSVVLTTSTPPAPRLVAKALIMGGTLMPSPSAKWRDMVVENYIGPTTGMQIGPGDAQVVSYPASAGLPPILVPTIDRSVAIGVERLDAAIAAQPAGERIIAFGFSQSTVSTMIEKARLSERKANGEPVPDVTFVGIGVGNRPHGGITTRLAGITIPIFGFTFNGPAPTDPEFGFETIDIAREYDGLADFPLYPLNLVSTLNAVLGVLFVHADYQEVSLDPASPDYVPGTIKQQYGDTTYYQIPTKDLPLFDPLRLIGVPEKVIDIFEPAAKVVVDAGYDRSIPFGEPTGIRLIPTIDRDQFRKDFSDALAEGLDNAADLFKPERRRDSTGDSHADADADADASGTSEAEGDSGAERDERGARKSSKRDTADEVTSAGMDSDDDAESEDDSAA